MSNRAVHSEHSRVADDECEGCSYCDLPFIRMHHEHDHAPVPEAMGGTVVIPACITCHDLKDRVLFAYWPAAETLAALDELTRCGLLAGLASADRLPDEWASLSRWARLAWAKMVRLALMDARGAERLDAAFAASTLAGAFPQIEG